MSWADKQKQVDYNRVYRKHRRATDPAYRERENARRRAQIAALSPERKAARIAGKIAIRRRARSGFTSEEYTAMLASQDGRCACCGSTQKYALSADHCHTTGRRRALLCIRCNVAIGVLEHEMRPAWDAYLLEHQDAAQ